MTLPKVCVLIINHNYGHWVTDAINSALIQDYPNKQLMIVDDGSTDNSIEVITKLCNIKNYKVGEVAEGEAQGIKIKLYSHMKALGPSSARNSGIKLAWSDTEIYATLDSDDFMKPFRISKLILPLIDNLFVGIVYSDYDVIDTISGVIRREYKEPFSLQRLMEACIIHSSVLIRKKVFEECGVYKPELRVAEDYSVWLRASQKFMVTHLPISTMYVRSGPYNATNTVHKEIWQQCHQMLSRDINGQ